MRKKAVLYGFVSVVAAAMIVATPALRAGGENINFSDINKIKAEGMQRSQVMELCSWLSDVYAPRLTGSPNSMKAAQWTVAKMKEWGFSNVAIEPWVNKNGFERGWTNDKFYMAVVTPEPFPIPGTPTAWTPGTAGPVSGEVVLVTAATETELGAYKGKLKGKWVLTAGSARRARDVAAASHAVHARGIGGDGSMARATGGIRRGPAGCRRRARWRPGAGSRAAGRAAAGGWSARAGGARSGRSSAG